MIQNSPPARDPIAILMKPAGKITSPDASALPDNVAEGDPTVAEAAEA